MNYKLRNSVYNNLIKARANFKHNQIFKETRLTTISQYILQTIHAHCNNDYQVCQLPPLYDFSQDPNTTDVWEWTDGYGRDALTTDFTSVTLGANESIKSAGTCTCPDGGIYAVAAIWNSVSSDCSGNSPLGQCTNGVYCKKKFY